MQLTRTMRARQEFYYLGRVLQDGDIFQTTDDDASYFLRHRKAEDVAGEVQFAAPSRDEAKAPAEDAAPAEDKATDAPPIAPRRRGRPRKNP